MGVPEGLRPRREEYELSGLHAKIWDILELCWAKDPADRLTIGIDGTAGSESGYSRWFGWRRAMRKERWR